MTRNEFIFHLTEQDCYPDEACDSEVSQLWHNAINGEFCYVPYDEEFTIITWAHIVYELRINPPLKYDSDYYVYLAWRESAFKESLKKK